MQWFNGELPLCTLFSYYSRCILLPLWFFHLTCYLRSVLLPHASNWYRIDNHHFLRITLNDLTTSALNIVVSLLHTLRSPHSLSPAWHTVNLRASFTTDPSPCWPTLFSHNPFDPYGSWYPTAPTSNCTLYLHVCKWIDLSSWYYLPLPRFLDIFYEAHTCIQLLMPIAHRGFSKTQIALGATSYFSEATGRSNTTSPSVTQWRNFTALFLFDQEYTEVLPEICPPALLACNRFYN